ncbi:MAG: MFS transporter [Candidatus Kerfeldbacteria bacterium]|nr:MFS transporter [Candidatus Kerfeldbacteria bacterium]
MRILDRFFKDANKKEAISWAFYDFANSSYTLLILSFVFPIYFKEVITGVEKGDFYWGLLVSVSILMGGLLAPIIGAIADYDSRKKIKFITFAVVSMIGATFLFFTGSDKLLFTSLIFLTSNIAFELAQTLYDSFLARVSTKETVGRISGMAWGLGYIGGLVAMLALKPLYENGYAGDFEFGYKLVFPLTALFFFLFSLPSFILIKEKSENRNTEPFSALVKHGVKSVIGTIKNLKQHKTIAWFLVGFYFMNDALVTIFAFTPIYARTTFGMEFKEILTLLLIAQIIAFPAATIFGLLSDKKGSKKILLFTIIVWAIIVALLSVATTKIMFYILALSTAFVIGSSQAIARSWLSKLVPDEKRFEFFGFNGFASKIAATTGPVLFGAVSVATGNQRLAMAALIPFFVIAFIIFARIKEERVESLPQISNM